MKTLPLSILSLCAFIIIGSFLLPVPTDNQQASIASAQSTPSFIITNQTVQTREGSSAAIKIKATTPVQATTKVCTTVSPDQGTTSRDYVKSSNTCVTFYKGGLSEKTLTVRTVRTQAEANKSLTVNISSTKVGTASTQRITPSATQTAKVLIADQKTAPGTILTGNNQNNNTNNNNNQNNNNTNLPPTNCAQYEGVIPGESRKLTIVTMRPPNKKYNYPMSAEGQAQHRSMFGYFGYIEHWFSAGNPPAASFGNRPRMTIESGQVFVVPFKTAAEYNYMPVVSTLTHETPETAQGVVAMSVSECPGDFTSPFFAGTPDWSGNVTIPGNARGKYCLSLAPSGNNQLNISVGNPGGFSCDLEPNKTYYFNITSGFSDQDGRKEGTLYPHIGKIGRGGTATTDGTFVTMSSMVIDTISYDTSIKGRTSATERDNLETIKGKSEYYAEHKRIAGIVAAALQQRVVACRTAIGSGATRTGTECRGLPTPLPAYIWE